MRHRRSRRRIGLALVFGAAVMLCVAQSALAGVIASHSGSNDPAGEGFAWVAGSNAPFIGPISGPPAACVQGGPILRARAWP